MPLPVEYIPVPQKAHIIELEAPPVLKVEYVPAAQAVHVLNPAPDAYVPGGHKAQAVDPNAPVYWPGPQAAHALGQRFSFPIHPLLAAVPYNAHAWYTSELYAVRLSTVITPSNATPPQLPPAVMLHT